ncbi:MAG: OmpA family protein [Chitinivibrionales bacterium]|nr:OmpA family protein [Chitinivibrionales bacterium]
MQSYKLLLLCAIVGILVGSAYSANTLSTGGHNGIVRSQSADLLGVEVFQLGGAFHYGQEMEYIHSILPNQARLGSPRLFSGVGYLAFGALPMLDVGFNLPAYYDDPQFGDIKPLGIGDLELSLKFSSPGLQGEDKVFIGACYMALQFPTGNTKEGFFPRHAYYGSQGNWSSGQVLFLPMLVSTIRLDHLKNPLPLRLNLNFGGVVNAVEENDLLTASFGFEYFTNQVLSLFAEVSAEERFTTVHKDSFFSDLLNDPVYVTPGFKVKFPNTEMTITVAADFGISESDKNFAQSSSAEGGTTILHQANPFYNAYVGLNWMIPAVPKDRDGDGIIDKLDQCPDKAEDKDGFEDADGCPEYDNDNDAIADTVDKCPTTPGIVENGGCPDVDTDHDNIVDRLDKCPDKPGIAELSGCPDVDSDSDKLVDRLDKCPNEAEDFDQYQDTDGCPDNDNDGDGFPDLTDKCPNRPGVAENEGCPKTKEITRGQLILKGVNFESGKAVLLFGSYKVLDEIAESLVEWPEVRVEIQGHTDNTGKPAKNLELSQQRAETVRQYLIGKGVAADRLTAVGYGKERPIADNKTASGRAQNRRVELNRLD